MFKVHCLDHIVLKTTNMDAMLKFYRDVLNCPVIKETPFAMHLGVGEQLIDLVNVDKKLTEKNLHHFCLRITPYHYEDLKACFLKYGIAVYGYAERGNSQGPGWSFFIKDPEENVIELSENK